MHTLTATKRRQKRRQLQTHSDRHSVQTWELQRRKREKRTHVTAITTLHTSTHTHRHSLHHTPQQPNTKHTQNLNNALNHSRLTLKHSQQKTTDFSSEVFVFVSGDCGAGPSSEQSSSAGGAARAARRPRGLVRHTNVCTPLH